MCQCPEIRINVRFWRMDQNLLGTNWTREVMEKEVLKLLQGYKMSDMKNYGIISHMDKSGKELD